VPERACRIVASAAAKALVELVLACRGVAEWHLEELRSALERRGWRIVEHPGDDYRVSGSWELRRSGDAEARWIDFDGLDDLQTLPMDRSFACRVRGSASVSLYFRRARSNDLWTKELATLVQALEKA
jgi:hypothetical protein